MRTREQQIADHDGNVEKAEAYAEGARLIIALYESGDNDADETLIGLRWELGASDHEVGVDIEDPFLTELDRKAIREIYEEASEAARQNVRGSR